MSSETTKNQRGLACPACGCPHVPVVYTRQRSGGRITRRRECRHCGKRFTTWEHLSNTEHIEKG